MRDFEIGIALGRIAGLRNHGEGPRVLALQAIALVAAVAWLYAWLQAAMQAAIEQVLGL